MWWFHRASWFKTTKTSVNSIIWMFERGVELNDVEGFLLVDTSCTIAVPFTNKMVGVWVFRSYYPSIRSMPFINENTVMQNMQGVV